MNDNDIFDDLEASLGLTELYQDETEIDTDNDESIIINNDEEISLLNSINEGVQTLLENTVAPLSDVSLVDNMTGINAYYFTYNGNTVYIPFDRVEYISKTPTGELINISSNTINCYALSSDGSQYKSYRFPSFAKAQEYNTYWNGNYSYNQWDNISVYADNSNLITGQTGLHNYTDIMLFFTLVFVACIFFFRKAK